MRSINVLSTSFSGRSLASIMKSKNETSPNSKVTLTNCDLVTVLRSDSVTAL